MAIFNVKATLYEGCCALGKLCAKHLALHKERGGSHCASGKCDVCKWNAKSVRNPHPIGSR